MKRPRALPSFLLIVLALCGCSRLGYYAHLGKGSLALVGRGRRVEALLADPKTPGELADRLRLAREVLEFADSSLGLPAGKKYRKYVDLGRAYVVWTVVAAPEFSLEPKTWCFPIAGCVGYRGFFAPDKAERFAGRLGEEGFDVSVGGVRAFSFLGWFEDPLLNTFVFEEDRQLAGLLFHELAHGLLYVQGDTAFNESFATALEREAVRRWLASGIPTRDPEDALVDYQSSLDARDRVYAVIAAKRVELESLYLAQLAPLASNSTEPAASPGPGMSLSEKRRRKDALFADLRRELASVDPADRTGFSVWAERDLGNADLASLGFYRERLAAFEALLRAVDRDLDRFSAAASCLASLESEERSRLLETREWSECILTGAVRSE